MNNELLDKDPENKETLKPEDYYFVPIITTKNTFLYPDDDFGIMTKGKVLNSIVYDCEINDNTSQDKMKIITTKKKKL